MKLGELIMARRRELDLTLEDVVKKAQSGGFQMSSGNLSTLTRHELKEAPRRQTMEALAYALDLSYQEIVLAVTESLIGSAPVEVSNLQHINAWVTLMGGRTDDEIASVLRVVRTVAATLDAARGDRPSGRTRGSREHENAPPEGGDVPVD